MPEFTMHVLSADGGYRNVTPCKHPTSKMIWAGISLALCTAFLFPIGVLSQTTTPSSASQGPEVTSEVSQQIRYEMPEKLRRQIAPTPSSPWQSPDLSGYKSELKSAERSPIDPLKRYDLVELIDLALRQNPETRIAWETARQAAIGVGLAESQYFPVLALAASGGYQTEPLPAPQDVAPSGFFRADLATALPIVSLRWLVLDFGRRKNAVDGSKARLLAANLSFNRKHQEIIFNVQRAFIALTSLRARIAVAQSAVDSARAVRESAEAKLSNGLGTLPEVLLARQQEAQASFDLEDLLATERDAEVTLAESIGIPPTTPIQITEFSALPAPAALEESADKVIDKALDGRPDLIARVAVLRGKEAEVRRARADYYPTLSLKANYNVLAGAVKITGGQSSSIGWFSAAEPGYGVGFAFEWDIFNGNATRRRVELAESERRAAEVEVISARDRAIRDVWKAYSDVRLAIRKLDVAAALVGASKKSYEANLESNRQGLGTLVDLLAARREYVRAQFVELDTKLQLLNTSSALAFSTGDPSRGPGR